MHSPLIITKLGMHALQNVISPSLSHSAATVVSKSIKKPGQYTGFFPLDDNAAWERNAATVKQLHSLRERIKKLESETKP